MSLNEHSLQALSWRKLYLSRAKLKGFQSDVSSSLGFRNGRSDALVLN
uniref:Uncharacterized protein n=1 Tax=Anguilla anguilla TaxID=7936 RepID=A0A0E9TZR5_ANGAN